MSQQLNETGTHLVNMRIFKDVSEIDPIFLKPGQTVEDLFAEEVAKQQAFLAGKRIGPPKATFKYTVEQLQANGRVGVYELKEDAMTPTEQKLVALDSMYFELHAEVRKEIRAAVLTEVADWHEEQADICERNRAALNPKDDAEKAAWDEYHQVEFLHRDCARRIRSL